MKMCRLSVLVVLLATLCLAYGQTPTKSSSMKPSTTTHVKPTVSPSPSPLPKNFNYSYFLMDEDDEFCLHMALDLAINFTYNTTHGPKSVVIHYLNQTSSKDILESVVQIDYENSYCNGTEDDPSAVLVIKYVNVSDRIDYFVTFAFNGSRVPGNMHWSFKQMSVNFTFNSTLFPDYKGKAPNDGEKLHTYSGKSLLDDSNHFVELTRPYMCTSNQTFEGFVNVTTDKSLNVSLFVRNLEVQAYEFTKPNGTFTPHAERTCLLDSTGGNQIVPIVVGAALGALVVIVLIAYLIGRIRNKRKSSYEKLS